MSDPVVSGVHHFQMKLPGAEGALLFSQCSTPQGSLEVPDFKTFSEPGPPMNSVGGGTQVSWAPITLVRGVDDNKALYTWWNDTKTKGVIKGDTKKDIELIALTMDNKPIHTWNIVGAVITSYGDSGANAQTNEVLVNTVQIKFEDATIV